MARFAVFITDPVSVEEFVGLARIDTEAHDERDACERAVRLHSDFSDVEFTEEDVAFCALLPEAVVTAPPFSGAGVRTFRPRWRTPSSSEVTRGRLPKVKHE